MSEESKESLTDMLLRKEKEGYIVVLGIDGLQDIKLDMFLKQPTEGLLYDLNRDKATCLSWLKTDKAQLWINNFAVAVVIEKLKEYYDKKPR